MAGLERYYGPPMKVEDLPRHLIDALVVSEDRRFFEHSGVDYRALGRAVLANLAAFDIVQGGSTLTQQTLENACFRRDPELLRKIKELAAAGSFEAVLAKREILYVYLNTIYSGRAYGVQAAARVYFDKYAQALTPLESALLVRLIPAEPLQPSGESEEGFKARRSAARPAGRPGFPLQDGGGQGQARKAGRPALVGLGAPLLRRRAAARRLVRDLGTPGGRGAGARSRGHGDAADHALARAAGDRRQAARARVAGGRAAPGLRPGRRPRHVPGGRGPGHGPRSGFPDLAVEQNDAGEAPARLGVQAVRLPRRARSGPAPRRAGRDARSTSTAPRSATSTGATAAGSRSPRPWPYRPTRPPSGSHAATSPRSRRSRATWA